MLFSEDPQYGNLMTSLERRIFVSAVGITGICLLVLIMAGYADESSVAHGWQTNTFQQNSNISAFARLKSARAWLIKAVSSVVNYVKGLTPKPILILYWTTLFERSWVWGEGSRPLATCPELVGQCLFTSNHSRINDSDILLFHLRDHLNLPPHHVRHQKWVFALMECPSLTYEELPPLQGVFNLTMTYARSAQVSWTYGSCEPLPPTIHTNYSKTFNYAANKKHIVAWFVSNCHTSSIREAYAEGFGEHVDLHQYGCGGQYICPKSNTSECNRLLNDDYKFYLSFENSLCRDYVTEKLWKILQINVVPIVLGYANYSEILPPHSYIDVRDFASPRHLADYLKVLNANDTLYNEYFGWRERYVCGESWMEKNTSTYSNGCALCRHALAMRDTTEIVEDIVAEWGREQNCVDAIQFYSGMEGILKTDIEYSD